MDLNLNPRQGGKDEEIRAELLRVVEKAGGRLYVVAPTYREFTAWRGRFAWGMDPKLFRPVIDYETSQGLSKPPYVVVNGWPDGLEMFHRMLHVGGVCLGYFYT